MRVFLLASAVAAGLAGCGGSVPTSTSDSLTTREVRLPNGFKVLAEIKANDADRAQGMMFRDSLAPDKGMLFVHERPSKYAYWMFNCRIPLDIIWLGTDKRIVEISPDTPPCPSKEPSQCSSFGGNETSQFVVELQAGSAARHNLRVGDKIDF